MMLITDLTVPGFFLLHAIESGRYDDISIKEVKTAIDNSTIFSFLEEKLGHDHFNHLTDEKKRELNEHWESLNDVALPGKFGVERLGLSLILGYLLEGIQNGTSRDGRLPEQRVRRRVG
jgi:hypothetical protein